MGGVAMFWKNPNIFGTTTNNEGTSLEKLVNGNARYAKFSPSHPDESKERLKELAIGQHPFAVMIEGGHPHGHIRDIVDSLSAEEEIKAVPVNDANRLDDCVKANVKHGIHLLQAESEIIREKLASKELTIVGARYDLDDLKVSVIEQ